MNTSDGFETAPPSSRFSFIFMGALIGSLAWTEAATLPLIWHWSNPAPHGNNIRDIAYGNGLYVQVCERGQIYTSDNLDWWVPRQSHTANSLRAVTFFGNRVVVTGENGTVLYADSPDDFRLVNLGSTDWLEGVTASPSLLVAVGDNGAIYTSSNGTAWVRRPQSFVDWLRSVAYGGGFFVAVGEKGFVASSQNGSNWQKLPSFTAQDLNKVAYINSQFWVVGASGQTWARDILGWQQVNSGAANDLYTVSGASSQRLLAGTSEVRLRENQTWSNELNPNKTNAPPSWTYLSGLWDGSRFLLAGRTGLLVEGAKTNTSTPFTWQDDSDSIRNWIWDVVRTPYFYAAVGDYGTVMTSANGLDWELELVPNSVTNSVFLGVGGTTNTLVAVGSFGSIIVSAQRWVTNVVTNSVTGEVTTNTASSLGVEWTAIEPRPTDNDLQGVTVLNDLFVVTGGAGTILTSANGTNWSTQTAPGGLSVSLSSVTTYPAGLVAVGDAGTILTSSNGVNWTRQSSSTTNWLYRVRYLGGKLIVVGENGYIATSQDGIKWTPQTSGTAFWLNDVTFIDNSFFAVGVQGTVLSSTNAVNWINIGSITQKSLYGAAIDNGQMIVVGIEGIILRSQVVPSTDPVNFVDFSRQSNQNLFLFAGKPDQRFTLQRSGDWKTWNSGIKLEFFDSSGTLLYLEETNSVPTEFFRTLLDP